MALDENISALIGRIYESAGDAQRWDRLFVELQQLFGACFVMQSVADLGHRELSSSTFYGGGTAAFCDGLKEYQQGLYLQDPSFHWAAAHPKGRFCDTSQIMPCDDWAENEFARYNHSHMGSWHWVVGYSAPEDELTFAVSVHPPGEVGPLAPDKKLLFKMLFEHMDRAVRLQARRPMLSSLEEPLICLDRLGQVREMSPAASELMDRKDGLCVDKGLLRASDRASCARLNAAILSALRAVEDGSAGGSVALPRPSGKRDLLVTVKPLVSANPQIDAFSPAALVTIVDLESRASPTATEQWTALFNLTPAEARLAEVMTSSDYSLRNAADSLQITYATARIHLKRVLEKTGTHSQSQLVRLLSLIH